MALVGFTQAAVTDEKGPSLPEALVHLEVVDPGVPFTYQLPETFGVGPDGAVRKGLLVVAIFPAPDDSEIDARKARNVYGLTKGFILPMTDPEGNRMEFSGSISAPTKKAEAAAETAATVAAETDVTDAE